MSELGLHCLHNTPKWLSGLNWVKIHGQGFPATQPVLWFFATKVTALLGGICDPTVELFEKIFVPNPGEYK